MFSHSECGTCGEDVTGKWRKLLNEEFPVLLYMCRYGYVCLQVSAVSEIRFPGFFLMFVEETFC